jgi:hypothetical protein
VETFFLGLLSGAVLAGIKTWIDRYQAGWASRKNTGAEAFSAAVAVHSATVSSLRLARQIEAELLASPRDVGNISRIANSADWHLRSQLDALKARVEKLRDARLSMRAIWGPHISVLFDDFVELTNLWLNALATYRDDIHGHPLDPDDDGPWDQDVSGFDWRSVIQGGPHGDLFERELERLMELIRKFARKADVAITELQQLPEGVREVVEEYEEHRQQRLLAVTGPAALPPPTDRQS